MNCLSAYVCKINLELHSQVKIRVGIFSRGLRLLLANFRARSMFVASMVDVVRVNCQLCESILSLVDAARHHQLIQVQYCLQVSARQWPDGGGRYGFNELHTEGVATGQFTTGHRLRTTTPDYRHKSALTTYCLLCSLANGRPAGRRRRRRFERSVHAHPLGGRLAQMETLQPSPLTRNMFAPPNYKTRTPCACAEPMKVFLSLYHELINCQRSKE